MTDKHLGLASGPVDADARTVNAIANASIRIGSPVVLAAPGTGELLPRVAETTSQGAEVYGVAVDGDNNGIYDDGTGTTTTEQVAAAAGEAVVICVRGRCKARVKGDGTAIVRGDPLTASATTGHAEKGIAADIIFALAHDASTNASDFIVVDVDKRGIF